MKMFIRIQSTLSWAASRDSSSIQWDPSSVSETAFFMLSIISSTCRSHNLLCILACIALIRVTHSAAESSLVLIYLRHWGKLSARQSCNHIPLEGRGLVGSLLKPVLKLGRYVRFYLTLSSPVVSNAHTSKCSWPYWSNPPLNFLTFGKRVGLEGLNQGAWRCIDFCVLF